MESKRIPFYGMLFLFLFVLGSNSILAQNVFVQDTFTSPDSGFVVGTANETFTVTVVTGDIPDIDYIEVYVYPYGAPGSATLLTTLGANDATGGDFTGFPNQTFTASGTDLIAAVAPGADSLYTIQALAFDIADVQTGETYTHVYADVDAPVVNFLTINGGAPGSYEPIIGGDTLIYTVDENYLFIDPDSVQFNFTVDTVSVSGTRSELLTDGILTDVTGNEYTFVVDLTYLVPSSASPETATLTVTDAGGGTDNASAAITIDDNTAPTVDLLSIDGASPTDNVVPNSISGYNTFVFDVRDTYLSSSVLDTLYNIDLQVDTENFTGTIPELESDGMLTVVGDTAFIFTINVKPHSQSSISVNLDVTDAAGNTGLDNNLVDIVDFETDTYFLMQPYPHTSFNQDLGLNIDLEPGNEANVTGASVDLSATADFSVIDTTYTLDDGSVFNLDNFDVPSDLVEGMYYVRATLDLDEGGSEVTRTNIVFYDTTAPAITIDLLEPQEFMGTEYLVGTSPIQFYTDDTDIFNIDVDVQRILLDSTSAFFDVTNMSHYPFRFDFNSRDYDDDATEELFDGTVVFRVITTDNTGNTSSPIYFPVNVDNDTPDYIVSEINGIDVIASEYDEALHPPVFAGDTLEMKFKYFADDFESAEFDLDYGPFNVEGWIVDNTDSVLTVEFYLPDSDTEYDNIDLTPNDDELTVTFTDVFGNGDGNYIGTPNVGHLKIYDNTTPYVYFDSALDGEIVRDTMWIDLGWDEFELLDSTAIQYATIDMNGDTSAFSTITTLSADSLNNYDVFVLPTADYADGKYILRTITWGYETDRYDGDMIEVIGEDYLYFRIDNTFSPNEAVTIQPLVDNTLHGSEDLRLYGMHSGDAYGAYLQGKFVPYNEYMDDPSEIDTSWVIIDSVFTELETYYFEVFVNDTDLDNIFDITNVEGVFTFRMVGIDSAVTYDTGTIYDPEAPENTGNRDDENTVATTMVYYDDIAIEGNFVINDLFLESPTNNEDHPEHISLDDWDSQGWDNFNAWNGTVSLGIQLYTEFVDITDFNRAVIYHKRYAAREPGVEAEFRAEDYQSLVTLESLEGEFEWDIDGLDPGAVYGFYMVLVDDFGNSYETDEYFFSAIGPRAHIVGMSEEHGEIYAQATPQTQSVKFEVSEDGGDTFAEVSFTDDEMSYITGSNYDGYKAFSFNVENMALPLGDLVFRLTAHELDDGEYDEFRFRNTTTLDVNHSESDVVFAKAGPENNGMQGILTPAIDTNLELDLYRAKGRLEDIRVEIEPINARDNVSLFLLADEDLYNTRNTLDDWAMYPRWATGYYDGDNFGLSNNPLVSLDGRRLGFENDNSTIDLLDNVDLSTGGIFYAYVTTVLPSGETIMNREEIVVNPIAAKAGGEVSSPDGNFTLSFMEESLEEDVTIYIDEDRSMQYFTHASDVDYGQVGTAYYLAELKENSLRNGRRINITMSYDEANIQDVNDNGSIADELEALCVGWTIGDATEIEFEGILNLQIDTDNQVVTFQLDYNFFQNLWYWENYNGSLGFYETHRFSLVLEGAVINNPGSMRIVSTSLDEKNYINDNDYLSIIITDDKVLSFDDYYISINGNVVNSEEYSVNGMENAIRIETDQPISGLNLLDGLHTVNFRARNDRGNVVDMTYEFILDTKQPYLSQGVQFVDEIEAGTGNRLTFTILDPMAGDQYGSGVDLDNVFVDVYLIEPKTTIVYSDSSDNIFTRDDVYKRYFKRYKKGELLPMDGSRADSLGIYFDVVFNQEQHVSGYEFVVHSDSDEYDESNFCSGSCDNDWFDIEDYDGYGIWDMTGNDADVVSFTVGVNPLATSTERDGIVPEDFHMDQNYPNPFNPSTTIQFGVPEASNVTIKVFNMLGREVATLVNEKKAAGTYQAVFDASGLASGMYIYRIVAGSFVQTKKLMLIK